MSQWNYYISGIHMGEFQAHGTIEYTWLHPGSAVLEPCGELDEEKNKELKKWSALDVRTLLQRLEAYPMYLIGEEVTLPWGERYSKREERHYVQRDVTFPTDILLAGGEVIAFISPARETTVFLVKAGHEHHTLIGTWNEKFPEGLYPIKEKKTCFISTRDGEKLATDIYLPDQANPVATVLIRTPYGKSRGSHLYEKYVHRGYAVVIQDVRGREGSSGEFIPLYHETEDGEDTLNWIASQPWCSGAIGMSGASYLGYVQWAAAASASPHLKAITSFVTAGSPFNDLPRRGGCFVSGMLPWAFALSQKQMHPELMLREDWDALMDVRPIEDIPKVALGHGISFLSRWLEHTDYDAFWERGDWVKRASGNQVPALLVSGWFDDNGMGTTEALEQIRDYPASKRRVILGPWNHNANTRYDIHGFAMGSQALRYDIDLMVFDWFEQHLRGSAPLLDVAPVEYFTWGANTWKQASSWPIPSSHPVPLYLQGEGEKEGRLGHRPLGDGWMGYPYDPRNPATHIINLSENELALPADYAEEEKRRDVLVFTTPVLQRPFTLTGDITVDLYVSSDVPDTDFVVRLTRVTPDHRSIKLTDGLMSARYREGFDQPKWLEKDRVVPLRITTGKISQFFDQGEQLRLSVTSSAKNLIFPNSNTKKGFNSDQLSLAHSKVHFGVSYPSRVILPIEKGDEILFEPLMDKTGE